MSIVITGASGQLGRGVIDNVLETTEPSELILVTRSPDELEEYTILGADVRHGDFNNPGTLRDALRGGERMLLISTDAVGDRVAQHGAAIDAAADVGVELVAYTSIINPTADNPAFVVPDHLGTEERLRQSGLGWTFLRNSLYAEFQAPAMAAAAESGVLVTNEGEGSVAYVSRDDCASAAAAVLVGGDHSGAAYNITGPELLDAAARAKIFSDLTGKPIEVVNLGDEEYAARLAEGTGMPPEAAKGVASFGRATREGHLAMVSSAMEELTGRQAASLREVLRAS
jgi:NAD(P)H dehydrogenase (quinone)